MMASDEYLLSIKGLSKSFGGLKAVDNFNLDQKDKELKGLIGPNGAGKTTVFNLITGYYPPDKGEIRYKGENIAGKKADVIVNKDIARTFQNLRMMENINVLEALKTATFRHINYNAFDVLLQTKSYRSEEERIEKKCYENLELFDVSALSGSLAGDLSYGDQRRVSIARALTLEPDLLLLDEPTAGLNPNETDALTEQILSIKDKLGLSILIVEHDMRVIMNICDSIVAMNQGQVIGEGTPEEIQGNREVVKAYLGGDVHA